MRPTTDSTPGPARAAKTTSAEIQAAVVAKAAETARVVARQEAQALDRKRGRKFAAWVVVITMVTAFGMWRVEQEAIARQVDGCERTNEFRAFLRDDLERRSTPLDIGEVKRRPEYLALPPDTRPIVDLFLASIATDRLNAEEVRAIYVREFPLVDCDELRRPLLF